MATKRSATSDLNHDNWDQEEEEEVQGTFQQASNDKLKNRVIRTAKRRNPIRSEDGEKKSAFASFTGFTTKTPNTDFSFLNSTGKCDVPKTNGLDNKDTKSSSIFNINPNKTSNTTNLFSTTTSSTSNIFASSSATTNSNKTVVPSSSLTSKSEKFCAKLKGLNESVSKWITKKVEENPLISLQPIFKDYEKYLNEIEKDEGTTLSNQNTLKLDGKTTIPTFNFTPANDKNHIAIPDSTTEKSADKKGDNSSTVAMFKFPTTTTGPTNSVFSFGSANNAPAGTKSFSSLNTFSSTTTKPTFPFGSNSTSSNNTPFHATTPLSQSDAKIPEKKETTTKEEDKNEENDNEDEPPKVEFQPVIEKDHIYTVKCKVFVKKDGSFSDRGVGNLFLKPIESSEKIQLIVRADTNLGNLLLNFILSENVPTKRMGKKDVMLVAIPTPDAKPPPVPLLVRVKTPEDADKLLEVLDKHKK